MKLYPSPPPLGPKRLFFIFIYLKIKSHLGPKGGSPPPFWPNAMQAEAKGERRGSKLN